VWVLLEKNCNDTLTLWLYKEVEQMNDEYDFTNAEQGKFYVPVEDIEMPIYLDKDISEFLRKKQGNLNNLQTLVNDLLRKDIG